MNYNEFWEIQRYFCWFKEELERLTAPFAAAHDVTGGQLRVLMALSHQDGQPVSALARGLCMADANMSTQVKRLCEKGLVERRRHEGDERQVRVSLTDKGGQTAEAFMAYCNHSLRAAMDLATNQEREAIRQGLAALEQVARRRAVPVHKSLQVRIYKENRDEL